MKWAEPTPSAEPIRPYHHGQPVKRSRAIDPSTRDFIAWDGEGVNLQGEARPQSYILFGCSEGHVANLGGLSTFALLDFILSIGEQFPQAIHVGFAFGYDSNMIVKTLSPVTLARLHRHGYIRLRRSNGARYTITFAKGKFFRVTRYRSEYDAKHNSTAKTTVRIFDIFSFFAKSFIKAYEEYIGPVPDVIISGKRGRDTFRIDEYDEILKYWTLEIQLLKQLAEELRARVVAAGLNIREWHGPGALATYAMREHNIKTHMAKTSDEIRLAARYGYAGGRFELFKVGRTMGPVYSIDINSAYPNAITELPSLSEGTWTRVSGPNIRPTRFGIYHVRMRKYGGFVKLPSPVFHRDKDHNVSFPWNVDGWYWSPEAWAALESGGTIVEGWEYRGAKTKPFAWVSDMYDQRRIWKELKIGGEKALKLCMNSMYGKLAQRVGWNADTQRMPPFHQLEWAGWVTSYTRAKLFDVMRRIPYDKLIAVETDGIYTTMNPKELGLTASTELGGWSIDEYAEVLYVQSGLAWLRKSTTNIWEEKRRGLDGCKAGHEASECDCPGVFSLNACREYLDSLHANPGRSDPWPAFKGSSTRFVGLGQALSTKAFSSNHCVWQHNEREILPGLSGKRVHMRNACRACDMGMSAYQGAHDLVISSLAVMDPHSYPHSIPWEPEEGHAKWRDYEASNETFALSGLE